MNIEKSFQDMMRKSGRATQSPNPHFNILHSDLSSSFTPGTTSDNIMIIPHVFENNNTSSSGSNGHIPGQTQVLSPRVDEKVQNVWPDFTPAPHVPHVVGHSMSNGSAGHSLPTVVVVESSPQFTARGPDAGLVVFENNASLEAGSRQHDTLVKRPVESESRDVTDSLSDSQKRKKQPAAGKPDISGKHSNCDINDRPHTLPVQESKTSLKPPTAHSPSEAKGYSDGADLSKKPQARNRFSMGGSFVVDNYLITMTTSPSFVLDDEAESLPLPPPCIATSRPHADFGDLSVRYPPVVTTIGSDETAVKEPPTPILPRRKPLLRSQSFTKLTDDSMLNNFYVNLTQELSSRNSIHDDSIYSFYRFYFNLGLVRVSPGRMSKKIDRRKRLSKQLPNLDFNKLEDHEQWYDRDFKGRNKDLTFCK